MRYKFNGAEIHFCAGPQETIEGWRHYPSKRDSLDYGHGCLFRDFNCRIEEAWFLEYIMEGFNAASGGLYPVRKLVMSKAVYEKLFGEPAAPICQPAMAGVEI